MTLVALYELHYQTCCQSHSNGFTKNICYEFDDQIYILLCKFCNTLYTANIRKFIIFIDNKNVAMELNFFT